MGSATQITLFVIPFCVVAAGVVGAPLSLDFLPFETGVFVFSVLGATTVMADGRSNWLKGLVLVAAYLVLAAAFWSMPHVICLDEPTNYLDNDTLAALTQALKNFKGAVVTVSHNEAFVAEISNEKWIVENGEILVAQ